MIVAVTGGTGFIGRHLIARHLEKGDEVRYLTRGTLSPTLNDAIPFKGDLKTAERDLRNFLKGADVLYHCAAELHDETMMHQTNMLGTANLLSAARGEVKRWVQLSSSGVYGNPRHQVITEESAIAPINAYERSKVAADEEVRTAAELQDLEYVILRPSNVYGPDMPNQSLFRMIDMIDKGLFFFIGVRGAIVNYIHVENVVDALVLCGSSELSKNGQVYIVSDYCFLEELVGFIAETLHKKPTPLRLPESWARLIAGCGTKIAMFPLTSSRIDAMTNRTIYKSDRIKMELGFHHRILMRDGITELTNYWSLRKS